MERASSFNLFRVNCLLNDSKSSNFNSVLLSIIYEYYYETDNTPKVLSDIYKYLKEYLQIVVDFDFLSTLITKSDDFVFDTLSNPTLISLKPEKFQEVDRAILANSITTHVKKFISETGLDSKYINSIESLLYVAVFENINSFSVDNLKTIIPLIDNEKVTKEDIEVFNSFLDYPDEAKNKSIFNIISRAVEFALLTSGKGIKEISQEIFNDKTFILDTNIFFRLLGVGGDERHESILDLIEKCIKLGIKFQYTGKTHIELHHKLDQIISYLNTSKVISNIDMIGEISETHPEMFNDDFIVHYSQLKRKGELITPEQYQRRLVRDYQGLLKKLGLTLCPTDGIDEGDMYRYSKYLLLKKREMKVNYGGKAAEVDASNIMLVRKIRGANNYNLSDVKSFYLTSDRSLNAIISAEQKSSIPDTILPSQLFILCKPYFDTNGTDDYGEFIKFIKRRKTGFKYAGSQVLTYINSIRELTTDVQVISESLVLYSDLRFKTAKENIYQTDSSIPNYKTVLKSVLDRQIEQGREAENIFQSLKHTAEGFAAKKFVRTRNIARAADLLLTASIIPLFIFLSKLVSQNLIVPILGVVIGECLKFWLSSRFKVFNRLHLNLYESATASKRVEYSKIHSDLVDILDDKKKKTDENIWKSTS